jgi:hypothetical protein
MYIVAEGIANGHLGRDGAATDFCGRFCEITNNKVCGGPLDDILYTFSKSYTLQ